MSCRATAPSSSTMTSNAVWFENLAERIREIHRVATSTGTPARRWTIPVCYGQDCRDDLDDLADRLKMAVDAVVCAHSRPTYMVYMIGFSPGFAYLANCRQNSKLRARRSRRRRFRQMLSRSVGGKRPCLRCRCRAVGTSSADHRWPCLILRETDHSFWRAAIWSLLNQRRQQISIAFPG